MSLSTDLSGAYLSEVMARVSFRLIARDYRHHPEWYDDPTARMEELSNELRREGWTGLATWVFAYALQVAPLHPLLAVRLQFIERSQSGQSWRSIVWPSYKAGRRADPRVTNRGVRASNRGGRSR